MSLTSNPFAECGSASARWRAGTDQESIEQTLKNIEVLDSEAKQTREKIKKAMQKHADVAHLVQLLILLFERPWPIAEKALRHPVFWPVTHATDLCYLLRESLEILKPLKKVVCDSMGRHCSNCNQRTGVWSVGICHKQSVSSPDKTR